jgi:hypothetical protein
MGHSLESWTEKEISMDIDTDKIDDAVLALLYLTTFEDRGAFGAWKGHDWDALNRLHEKGMISDPKTKAKSVALSESGKKRSKELFEKLFTKKG